MKENLTVHHIRKEISRALQQTNQLILHAPTGSGKSTLVPQFIKDDLLSQEQTVFILQPRRIAARLLAGFIASERSGKVGEEVGYQVRLDSQHSEKTKILFVTEGILLNRLLQGETLSEVGAIIFDEFHERHLETDLSLALTIQLQQRSRPDLKIIVMSATLELEKVQSLLKNSITLESAGRTFPVTVEYRQPKPYEAIWEYAACQLELVLPDFKEGSALVFMPGVYEIKKTIDAISKKNRLQSFDILPLYSSLPGNEQDKAVQPGGRKIIVTTNVAETSITLPGITLVIDSGLARIARFDPRRGINTLFIEPISKASADQRAGRAGRLSPGRCIRLWSEFSHLYRQDNNIPEIHRLDLSETILGLSAIGENPESFPWIESPGKASVEKAKELLHDLGAIDNSGGITVLGRRMAGLNVHPRLGRILVEAEMLGCLPAASVLVAITQSSGLLHPLSDPEIIRDRLNKFGHCGSDLIFELNVWLWAGAHQFKASECNALGINSSKARDIGKLALQILRKTNTKTAHSLPQESIGFDEALKIRKCIFSGFGDFLAVRHRQGSNTCQMTHGRSGQLHRDSTVQEAKYMVVTEMEETKSATGTQIVLRKVTEIDPEWLNTEVNNDIKKEENCIFDTNLKRFVQVTEYSRHELVLKREQGEIKNDDLAAQVISKAIREGKISFPQWDEDVEHFVNRVNFASKHTPHYGIPAIHEDEKDFIIQQAIYKCRSMKEIQKCNIWPSLKSWMSYEQLEALNYVAPEYFVLPHRKKPVKLRYDEKGDVFLSETIQALYDCPLPVTVAEGKVSVIFELLAPSRRPVQTTRDLEYFWKNSYLEVRKELKGRYPKHEWR